MSKIKVSELFNSIQGEGRYAGVPSIFLRTFGCNFRCPSFGRDHSESGTNKEVEGLIANIPVYKALAKSFVDLPLVNTGCDTYAAVYPEFKDFSPMYSTQEIADKIIELLPEGYFHKEQHLIFTGGEPLLPGWQKSYPELIDVLVHKGAVVNGKPLHVTVETNGTQKITDHFKTLGVKTNLHFSVSTKMMASGESREDAVKPDVILEYMVAGLVDLKFVVDSETGFEEVMDLLHNEFKYIWKSPSFGSVYVMPEGATNEAYQKNQRKVADLCMKYGFRFSPRLQNIIYGNEWST